MTNKVYRSAMGTPIDMGALALQNENERAVGNMNVNARGDKLDSKNRVVESRSQTVQKQYKKQTLNPSRMTPHTSNVHARKEREPQESSFAETTEAVESVDISEFNNDTFTDLPDDNDVVVQKASVEPSDEKNPLKGGLAGAIARSREVRQEKEKSLRELKQEQPLKRI